LETRHHTTSFVPSFGKARNRAHTHTHIGYEIGQGTCARTHKGYEIRYNTHTHTHTHTHDLHMIIYQNKLEGGSRLEGSRTHIRIFPHACMLG
jgi:hypothetical protein